ncbi:MAG: 3-oxoacyl-ACP reductase FabG [Clostridiales bacterium]|nr:3-oxoacyl-ACP reductase FabG [Candidatus Scatonaster coprocaballi]
MEHRRKHCLITGGSRGIGAATAYRFAQAGYRVTFFYRADEESAEYTKQRIQQITYDCLAYQVDVRDFDAVQAAVNEAIETFGPVDVLVSNAGVAKIELLTKTSPDEWARIMDTNIGGLYHLVYTVLPSMIARHSGSIVTVSSMWGISGASCEVAYSTSKAAIIGFTKALAQEVGPSSIRVNCVAPGVIDTEMNAELDDATRAELSDQTPLCRIGSPEEVADAIFYLAEENASFITGQVLGVNGGFLT